MSLYSTPGVNIVGNEKVIAMLFSLAASLFPSVTDVIVINLVSVFGNRGRSLK